MTDVVPPVPGVQPASFPAGPPFNYTVSRNGTLFIARREALVLTAYPDGPHMSIGFGHNNPKLGPGDTITPHEAFALLKQDIAARTDRINNLLKVPVLQHQFDAIMSLHYQSGNRYAPALIALINAKQIVTAAEFFTLCARNLAGDWIEGLHKRRMLEQTMFLGGGYGDDLHEIPFWRGNPKTTKRETYTLQPDDV